ncbi:DNA-binding protein [Lentzea aerocolonigenes]|uniref:DNA-binding protein n=1 Tax=Lentzea aerocolonigenes TaxID=68170 RepID=A0A0F0H6L3_LENAE|nr:APC family permease [Lentzea aerocolonigenes]KJK49258.1 DNA-binding protein [Lentzea aerocolonigenes]
MTSTGPRLKRLLIGSPVRSDRRAETLLPKRLALPIFASDPLSSVAYATQEIMLILTLGGLAFLHLAPFVGLAVALLLVVVVVSYRQVVRAYPGGGGSYEVVSRNLGAPAGIVVAGALLVDYVLTVAVSVTAGVDNLVSMLPALHQHRLLLDVAIIALLAVVNLRGVRESGRVFALPTYLFVAGVLVMIVAGLARTAAGAAPVAESAGHAIRPELVTSNTVAIVFLVLRAFSSGCTALTGAEAISNGVPAFREPKARNAARTMTVMGLLAVVMFAGVTALAVIADVHYTQNTCDLVGFAGDCATQPQRTVVAQLAAAVFGGHDTIAYHYLLGSTALVLVLAANTGFNGFPLLTSILARDSYLPRQLATRGGRLALSNGILLLAFVAITLVLVFGGSSTRLIQLYIVGVFTSFTLCQTGMVRHWTARLADCPPAESGRVRRARLVNAVGAVMTGVVLVVVVLTKFTHGAYLVVLAIPLCCFTMLAVRRHYRRVGQELALNGDEDEPVTRVHGIVLVAALHKPTLRALAFARATGPASLTALTVALDGATTGELRERWAQRVPDVPLVVVDSPYREMARPVVEYVRRFRAAHGDDLVCVFVPEYVVGRWWEALLHNQSALRLKGRLLFERGVMVANVPWHLESSSRDRVDRPRPGDLRLGIARAADSSEVDG